ncbi:MAG: hss [Chloroflexi bacterium]|nr:hss [Chloroflexota bacterium]
MTRTDKKIVILGFGNIGQAIIPLLKKHFADRNIWIIEQALDRYQAELVQEYGMHVIPTRVLRDNYLEVLSPMLETGDFLLNLATSISSKDLIDLAQANGSFYLDTCIDPWTYSHSENGIDTSNYFLREQLLELRSGSEGKPTAIVAHGANPGYVSILVKHALIRMATKFGVPFQTPKSKNEWAKLAKDLDVRVVQISERDTQVGTTKRTDGEFVNTWSVDGFVTECLQPAEMGWGTHEVELPKYSRSHAYGSKAAIYIEQPGFTIRVKSWSPNYLDFDAYLITHNEAISIADYLTYREDDLVSYRPTCYYAYHPCDEAVESLSLLRNINAAEITSTRILKDEISSGIDELGVFLISGTYPSLWMGSNLSIGKARKMAKHNNATSLQVVASAVAGMAWAIENPDRGVLESEDLDHEFIFDFANEYWSPMVHQYINWRPREDADELFFADFLVKPERHQP